MRDERDKPACLMPCQSGEGVEMTEETLPDTSRSALSQNPLYQPIAASTTSSVFIQSLNLPGFPIVGCLFSSSVHPPFSHHPQHFPLSTIRNQLRQHQRPTESTDTSGEPHLRENTVQTPNSTRWRYEHICTGSETTTEVRKIARMHQESGWKDGVGSGRMTTRTSSSTSSYRDWRRRMEESVTFVNRGSGLGLWSYPSPQPCYRRVHPAPLRKR
ncbi:hypothetical protein EX30DRAFT_344062 [Ascodesmis nigricans]|uniref:Uncharacterized protein n=1 Tax=Ascodesmis nigricans TaxID=341454 RepID=A0A4S2MKW1_9PEZI|nr:hypothetical protein EX30DRAFT_344062 [Ascodesmis nigricans]